MSRARADALSTHPAEHEELRDVRHVFVGGDPRSPADEGKAGDLAVGSDEEREVRRIGPPPIVERNVETTVWKDVERNVLAEVMSVELEQIPENRSLILRHGFEEHGRHGRGTPGNVPAPLTEAEPRIAVASYPKSHMIPSLGARANGLRLERMKASSRFRDGVFRNTARITAGLKKGTAAPTISEFLRGGHRRTPSSPLPCVDPSATWSRPPETPLRATWLGHSTVLLEIDGVRVLTDPVWGDRASPVSFAGPKRFQPVPVPIAGLPPIDAVVISHDHYDHLDYPTILELARLEVPFFTSLGVGAHIEAWGIPADRITELDWWESAELPRGGLTITAAPSQHFSGRALGGRNTTLWSSLVLRGERSSAFFSGDTGLTPEYSEIQRRLGPFDLVMLEVGAFHPAWGDIHLGPENALKALGLLGGVHFLPVHWGTFNLALHAWDEPAETLVALAPSYGARLVMPRLGEPVEPSRTDQVDPWWRTAAGKPEENRKGEEEPPSLAEEVKGLAWPID